MEQEKFSIRKRLNSFKYAFNGLGVLIKNEHNAWIHLFASVLVIIAGFYFKINTFEWLLAIIAIGLVFMAELINTSIEYLCNLIMKERHSEIKKIKDMAAAAVIIAALIAVAIGLFIFVPHIITEF